MLCIGGCYYPGEGKSRSPSCHTNVSSICTRSPYFPKTKFHTKVEATSQKGDIIGRRWNMSYRNIFTYIYIYLGGAYSIAACETGEMGRVEAGFHVLASTNTTKKYQPLLHENRELCMVALMGRYSVSPPSPLTVCSAPIVPCLHPRDA